MRSKFLKISIVLLLIITLSMYNFIFLGVNLISYAIDDVSTNHKNIEFSAYFKNEAGEKINTLERTNNTKELSLYLSVSVKKEGFFNGEIELANSNFDIKESESEYVNKISENRVYLNQLNAGTTAEIELKVTPVEKDIINLNMLNCQSEIKLTGIYRDSTEKDINITANKTVTLNLIEENTNQDVENEVKVITNKILKIDGEDKRVIQLSLNMGLKENNYPIKEIHTKINVPKINGIPAQVIKDINLNTMSAFEYKYEDGYVEITLKNEKSEDNYILWKKQGNENVILTYIYNPDVNIENIELIAEEEVILHNDKTLTSNSEKLVLSNEEIDSTVEVGIENEFESIYKGKLYASLEKEYNSKTTLKVNLANTEEYISVKEESSKYIAEETEYESDVYYNQTKINKESFQKIFGDEGNLKIYDQDKTLITEITNEIETDEDGNFVIEYEAGAVKGIEIVTSTPISEGNLEFNHLKTIKTTNLDIVKKASAIKTKIVYGYNNYDETSESVNETEYTKGIELETEAIMNLKETTTEAKLELNRDSLSTIVLNDLEMKLILKTDDESKDLYKNPTFEIELPEQVEEIQIDKIDLLYEDELKISNHTVNGRIITIELEGEQTSYKTQSIEGANIIIDAKVKINKTSIAKEENITVRYSNEKANTYVNGENEGNISKAIEIVAPKDVTAINTIESLDIETIGDTETEKVTLQRGTNSKQLEIKLEVINNNEQNITNVSILGEFPTKSNENNIDIKVIEGINIENAKVYYTENSEATKDINDSKNGWTETITDTRKIRKYLIVFDKIDSKTSITGTYKIEIPENLEYNQTAKEGYEVTYTNSQGNMQSSVKSTYIIMETGVGPKIETVLTATVAGKDLTEEDRVKNNEVIKYKVKISNIGSEDVTNIRVVGQIPEGTMLVEPVKNYEYTGASYYKSINVENYETTIETLKVGEVKYIEYEVMISSKTSENISISNVVEVNYSDVIQKTNEFKTSTEVGTLRAMVKRVTDRKIDLYEQGTVQYFAIVKNTTDTTINDVKVKTFKSENLRVSRLTLISGMLENEINDEDLSSSGNTELKDTNSSRIDKETESEIIEYSDEINIGNLAPGEVKVLSYNMVINKMPENTIDKINFSVEALDGEKVHRSNKWEDSLNSFDIDITMQSNTQSKYVKSGDKINYTIKLKNNSTVKTSGLIVRDKIPSQLTINKVSVNGEEIKVNSNNVEIAKEIDANGEMTIIIETIVNYSDSRTEAETIINRAIASVYGEEIATTAEINHIIEADVIDGNPEDPDDPDNPDNPDKENNGDIANGKQIISGLAWYDENGNGKKDSTEATLKDISVRLLNVQTNNLVKTTSGNVLEVKTNENGVYVLENIVKGKYIVIFDYNKAQYSLTKYKAEGVSDAENSDVRMSELSIESSKQEVAATDIVDIDQENISDINIGLIELKDFDLKLDKVVNKIIIQNSAGTTVREYNNTKMAKVEIDAKQIKGSTVIVEYNIIVSNVGEVPGYARSIVDYLPNDLEFNSEINKEWYQKDNALYTTILGNDIINPGESKIVTLTLTKTLGENNIVSRNNAEIKEAYNDLGLADINSTPGNNVDEENDKGTADVIISIRTGGVTYMSIIVLITILVLASIATVIIVKRKNLKRENK